MSDPTANDPTPPDDPDSNENLIPQSSDPPLSISASEKENRNWALIAHLSSLSSFVGIPGFIGPLVVWLIKKDELPFAAAQAKEALNFQITLLIYCIICVVLLMTVIGALIAIPGFIALVIIELVFTILATIKAGEGEAYRYPMTIRLID